MNVSPHDIVEHSRETLQEWVGDYLMLPDDTQARVSVEDVTSDSLYIVLTHTETQEQATYVIQVSVLQLPNGTVTG